jgi:subtilisin family serine protease
MRRDRRPLVPVSLTIAASINSSTDAGETGPGNIPDVLTVNATGKNDERAVFSNYGSCTDLFAPGDNITSLPQSGFITVSGGAAR